jgi:hypothetical protein
MSEPVAKESHLKDEFGPSLSDADMEKIILEKGLNSAPRVTKEGIEAKIDSIQYMQLPPENTFTICAITMRNGFSVIGHSAPASPENFDKDLGRKIAYDVAFRQLWALEGYLLKEVLHAAAKVAMNP